MKNQQIPALASYSGLELAEELALRLRAGTILTKQARLTREELVEQLRGRAAEEILWILMQAQPAAATGQPAGTVDKTPQVEVLCRGIRPDLPDILAAPVLTPTQQECLDQMVADIRARQGHEGRRGPIGGRLVGSPGDKSER